MATVRVMPQPEAVAAPKNNWREVSWLPCRLSVEIPVPRFTFGDLLRLEVHSVVDTHTATGSNVALRVNGQLIGLAELEVRGEHLAVRLTEFD